MSVPVMVAVAAGALVLGVPVILASNAAVADARAASAADAAALAAADATLGLALEPGGEPCTLAKEVAHRNGAAMSSCDIDPRDGDARVSVTVRFGVFTASRSAHAGPSRGAPAPLAPAPG